MGLKLLPLSLGHVMILKSVGSMFFCEDVKPTCDKDLIVELITSVLICSVTFDEFWKEYYDGQFQIHAKEYIEQYSKLVSNSGKLDFCLTIEVQKFLTYIKNGTSGPKYTVVNSNPDDISSNPIEAEEMIKDTLLTETNLTRDEIHNLPLTEIISSFITFCYKKELVKIDSKEMCELRERIKQYGPSNN